MNGGGREARYPTRDHFIAIAWCGLAAGALELAWTAYHRWRGTVFLGLGQDRVWMTPLAYLLIALGGLAVGYLVTVALRPAARERVALAFVLVPLSISLLSLPTGLARWSILILALGLGVAGSALLVQASWFHKLVRLSWPVLLAVPLVAGSVSAVRQRAARQRAVAALPVVDASAPNVLLVVWDVVRAGSVSAIGYPRRTTPNLERFAGTGVRFTRAQAPSSWTNPSHASLFTGREAFELSTDWNSALDATFPTLAEAFGRRGYRTGGFVGNVFRCSYESGLQRGFDTYEDYRPSPGELVNHAGLGRFLLSSSRFRALFGVRDRPGRRSAPHINARFLRWVDRRGNRPFFAFVNYYDAHEPYLPPAPFDTLFGPVLPRRVPGSKGEPWTPEGIAAERDSYERTIAAVDAEFGRLLEALRQRGLLDNTLVIVLSDHGEEFMERGVMYHGHSLNAAVVNVPLVLSFPGRVPAGRTLDRVVSLRDMAATIQSLTGLAGEPFPGRSLERVWTPASRDTAQFGDVVFGWVGKGGFGYDWPSSSNEVWSVAWQGWRYVRYGATEELFSQRDDPAELRDLSDVTPVPALLPRLRALADSIQAVRGARLSGSWESDLTANTRALQ